MNFFSYICTKLKFHMPKRTPEIEQLLVDVEEKFGTKPHSPADFNELILAIQKETDEVISLSTLERMWGYVNNVDRPRISSLNILAHYTGYKDWHEYLEVLKKKQQSNSNHILEGAVLARDLGIGRLIGVRIGIVQYVFRYLGKYRFEVVAAKYSMMKPGDTFTTAFFIVGHPLYLDNWVHGDEPPRIYAAGGGISHGVSKVWLINDHLLNLPKE